MVSTMRPALPIVTAVIVSIGGAGLGCRRPNGAETRTVAQADVAAYRDAAARIADATRGGAQAYHRVADLADLIGPRMVGSPALVRAVTWAHDAFAADKQQNVSLDPVRLPVWARGNESAEIVGESPRRLAVLGLGGTVGTPPGGLTAEVAVVSSLDELAKLGASVRGRIVLLNCPFPPGNPALAYAHTIGCRVDGPTRAAALGAVAALVRSLASASLGAPHTGWTHDGPGSKIPAAALSVEDAQLVARLAARGQPVSVHLELQDGPRPDATSFNVLAELRGRDQPEELVVIGAHLDSWDVGEGAQDDGAGVAIVMESLATLRRLHLIPRRTIRAVLYTSEEEEARGGQAYGQAHDKELAHVVAAFETDVGAGAPLGFRMDGVPAAVVDARGLAALLAPIGATAVDAGFAGADISHIRQPGKPGPPMLGLFSDPTHYFDVHHSVADTLEKIDPVALGQNVAAMATMAYVVADRETRWPSSPPPPPPGGGTKP